MNAKAFIQEYFKKMKYYQEHLLNFLDCDDEQIECNFNMCEIGTKKDNLKGILHLISKIAKHHHRNATFLNKIEKILKIFSEDIKNFFSNSETFNIFKKNKRILLFLFEEKIIQPTEEIYYIIINEK